MSSPVIRDHDNAVVAAVASIGRPTGYGDAPAGALANLLKNPPGPGYYIVYPLPGGMRDGSMSDPYADVELVYQVTCVDRGPEGVRWLTDQLESKFAALQSKSVPVRMSRSDSGEILACLSRCFANQSHASSLVPVSQQLIIDASVGIFPGHSPAHETGSG